MGTVRANLIASEMKNIWVDCTIFKVSLHHGLLNFIKLVIFKLGVLLTLLERVDC